MQLLLCLQDRQVRIVTFFLKIQRESVSWLFIGTKKDLLNMLKEQKEQGVFKKIILLVNSNWAMELGDLDDYDVDACLWIGSPGIVGFTGVVNLLQGEANPSGKLVDTYAKNSLSAPAITYAQMKKYARVGESG